LLLVKVWNWAANYVHANDKGSKYHDFHSHMTFIRSKTMMPKLDGCLPANSVAPPFCPYCHQAARPQIYITTSKNHVL